MKSALLSKIAMCICPPAIVATSAVTVPPIKRAVHRATAPSHMPAVDKPRARRVFTAAYDCTPGSTQAAQGAPVQRLTDAAGLPTDIAALDRPVIGNVGPLAFNSPGFTTPGAFAPIIPINFVPGEEANPVSPIPEASTWVMTIGGFAAVGVALRRKPGAPAADPADA